MRVGKISDSFSLRQKKDSLKKFEDDKIDILLATDDAVRGLDIRGVETVINYTMPSTFEEYLHRVARNARAGKTGRSVSIVGEADLKIVKEIAECARNPIESRTPSISPSVQNDCAVKIKDLLGVTLPLSLFISFGEFESVSINLWSSFIHSVSLSSLVEVLPQVLPLLDSSPDKTRELFKFLLEENLDQFKAQVPYLVFLSTFPQLEDIVGKVRGEGVEFKEVIRRLLHCLDHECVDVRLQTLNTLSGLIDNNMGSLQGLIVCSDRTDPVVTSKTARQGAACFVSHLLLSLFISFVISVHTFTRHFSSFPFNP